MRRTRAASLPHRGAGWQRYDFVVSPRRSRIVIALGAFGVLAAPVLPLGCGSCEAPAGFRTSRDTSTGAGAEAEAGDAGHEGSVATATADAALGGELPPLRSTGRLVSLAVPGFADAVVSVPVGARRARPVMIAVHGNYDSPDFQCGQWRSMVGDRGFILCPRGVARSDSPGPDDIRYTYEGKFAAELDAAIAALRERFGAHVDPGPMSYIAFSLGAILARGYVMRAPSRFDRLILIEGGGSGWDARALSKAGMTHMLWACGQAPCADTARVSAAAFERASIPSKVVYAKGAGHTYGGPVAELIRAEWEWLVTGDPRWAP